MAKGKKSGDRPELLTKEEMSTLILSVATKPYYFTLYNLLKYTGRRIGEIYGTYRNKNIVGGLKVNDIDFDNKTIRTQILKTKKRKMQVNCSACNNKTTYKNMFCPLCGVKLPEINKSEVEYNKPEEKIIMLKAELIPILQSFIKNEKLKSNDFVFRKYSLICLKKNIKRHTKDAGISKNFSLHGFRHYFITQCKRANMSNEDIAKWTGHKSPQMLNVYDRRTSKDIDDKIDKVEL